ncbi:MAG: DUF2877 domain-containing protein [SAR324 cluster bacterium]|nr:DUF2877 domain-containing protein [SAR324 cluster bacterium]
MAELNGPGTELDDLVLEGEGLGAVVRLPVTQAGRRATNLLRAPLPGRVAHVFERCFYLENSRGEMACVGEPSIGAGPLNALLGDLDVDVWPGAPWWRLLRPGHRYTSKGGEVWVGNGLVLCVRNASLWRAPHPARTLDRRLLECHLRGLRRAAQQAAPKEGLSFLVTGSPPPEADSLRGAIAAQAVRAVIPLSHWLAGQPEAGVSPEPGAPNKAAYSQPPPAAEALLGLGPGLTPSGDDLICGLLLALHALDRPAVAHALAQWALPLARHRCSPLSAAHLSAAAEGEGASALHELLQGLGRDATWTAEPHISALAGHGHTSGWDALAGVWLAMSVYAATAP